MTDKEKIDNIFNNPLTLKYYLFKDFLMENQKFDGPIKNNEIVNRLILDNYIYRPFELIRFIFKYSTYARTLMTSSYLLFSKKVMGKPIGPFGEYSRENGPYSNKLHNILKSFYEKHNDTELRHNFGVAFDKFEKDWLDKDQNHFC